MQKKKASLIITHFIHIYRILQHINYSFFVNSFVKSELSMPASKRHQNISLD